MCAIRPALACTPMCDEVGGPFCSAAHLHLWLSLLPAAGAVILAGSGPSYSRLFAGIALYSHSVSSRSDPLRSLNQNPPSMINLRVSTTPLHERDLRGSKIPEWSPKASVDPAGLKEALTVYPLIDPFGRWNMGTCSYRSTAPTCLTSPRMTMLRDKGLPILFLSQANMAG